MEKKLLTIKAEFAAKILEKLENMQLVSLNEQRKSVFGIVEGESPQMRSIYNQALADAAETVMEILKKEKTTP